MAANMVVISMDVIKDLQKYEKHLVECTIIEAAAFNAITKMLNYAVVISYLMLVNCL